MLPNAQESVAILILSLLCAVYLYVIVQMGEKNPAVLHSSASSAIGNRFNAIALETKAEFTAYLEEFKKAQVYDTGGMFGAGTWEDGEKQGDIDKAWERFKEQQGLGVGRTDDFFLDVSEIDDDIDLSEPIVPSSNFYCRKGGGLYVSLRSDLNYKFMWMHGFEDYTMSAAATIDTPLHLKTFEIVPVDDADCDTKVTTQRNDSVVGWVRLRSVDRKEYIYIVPPPEIEANLPPSGGDGSVSVSVSDSSQRDDRYDWMVRTHIEHRDNEELAAKQSRSDPRFHFLIEKEGYILNRGVMGYLNVFPNKNYEVAAHSLRSGDASAGKPRRPAQREFTAQMVITAVAKDGLEKALAEEEEISKEALDGDLIAIQQIAGFPSSAGGNGSPFGKRVISFGLYGKIEKYTTGALRNAELALLYYPGWICRFYHTSDVPGDILRALGGFPHVELVSIPDGQGYMAGMFYRFLVAMDPTVDRFLVRDTDSRLNARERLAVEDWITKSDPSKAGERDFPKVHILRDHVNHCYPISGGMWGGIKGALPEGLLEELNTYPKDEYMADINFLREYVWPAVVDHQMAHDSYCCDQFPLTVPFPSRRRRDYQHIGQVFNAHDEPRLSDIDDFIRGLPTPSTCRAEMSWIYG